MKYGVQPSLNRLRKSRAFRVVCAIVALETLFGQFGGLYLHALTSGPEQPEASSFTPADISNLVDPFSGGFSYNIPLMEIGGYPINLAYSGGATMDQEATWAGLGWNVNTGSIVRDVRGLPDDFLGDEVERKWNMKPNLTAGAGADFSFEAVGFPFGQLSFGAQISYNNYTGVSVSTSLNPGVSIAMGAKQLNVGLGMSAGGDGLSISPNVSFSNRFGEEGDVQGSLGLNIGLPINSRTGAQGLSFGASFTRLKTERVTKYDKKAGKIVEDKETATSKVAGIGGMLNFGGPTHTPSIEIPFTTFAFTGKFSMGAGIYGGDADISLNGFVTEQKVRNKGKKYPAFGYNYLQAGQLRNKVMLDFNREKDGSFSMNTPNLPQTSLTYDVYNIMAQGIGGSFRPFRNEVGYVFDPEEVSISNSGTLGIELSGGQVVNVGGEFDFSNVTSRGRAWLSGNTANPRLKFKWVQPDDLRENWHFRLSNEMAVNRDDQFLNRYGGYQAERPVNSNASELLPKTRNIQKRAINLPLDNAKQHREIRNTAIIYHTAGEVRRYFPHNAKYLLPTTPSHHIAQITIITGEGKVYVFGLPAYNHTKNEVTMAVGNIQGNPLSISGDGSYVTINSTMASPNNKQGIDHFYDETITPAYVHTWFLTEVYSADYSDITGNGPSEDDLGNYTLFTYGEPHPLDSTRRQPDISSYFWKTPMSGTASLANYSEGLKSMTSDDKGSLVYGTKDVWYLKTIESKTQVVAFELSNREDGYGATGAFGGPGGSPLQKIDEIHLYAKEDYLANGSNATSIKTVHFEYDYSLCDGVPNNLTGGGKLTLKKVYFTFEKSGRSKFSPYQFDYGETDATKNPDYAAGKNDRWGGYKVSHSGISNVDYSYAHQDRIVQDAYASAWCLREIITPSGGKISVEYESNDYAYVQDKQAARMFRLTGAGSTNDLSQADENLFVSGSYLAQPFLFFELDETIDAQSHTALQANQKVVQDYIKGWHNDFNGPGKHLYFRVLVNVSSAGTNKKEYVSGYAEIAKDPTTGDYWGGATRQGGSGPYTHGYVRLKLVPLGDSGTPDTQPISKAAWQFSRINTPRYAYNQPDPSTSGFEQLLKALGNANLLAQIFEFFQGPNRVMRNKGFGSSFDASNSFIRLYKPDGHKLGGGVRVKTVSINDSWGDMEATESSFDYGQSYTYALEDGRSSGVASWEPAGGADENPHRYPIYFDQEKALVPDDRFYQETPLCEGLFPAPSVGYSRVVVKNLNRTGVTINGTGYTEHQFYTAKDFPTKISRTDLNPARQRPPFILSLLNLYSFDYMSATQGFYIELNDMHGKPKATRVFGEGQTVPLQETKHYYNLGSSGNLSSMVPVLQSDGVLTQRELGVDVDMVFDFREHSTVSTTTNIPLNLAFFLMGLFPAFIPTAVPTFSGEETRFRSATFTKVVRRTGIEMKTEQVDLGSRVVTENKAFDPESGSVLVTQVNNEYEDDRYAVNVPAYWAYPGMGHATQNWGVVLRLFSSGGQLQINSQGELTGSLAQHLFPGDVVSKPIPGRPGILKYQFGNNTPFVPHANRWWVSLNSSGNKVIIDAGGSVVTPSNFNFQSFAYIKVIKSGRQNLIGAQVEQVEMLESPFRGDSLVIDQSSQLLSASAIEYDQRWKMFDNRLYYSQDSLVYDCRFQSSFTALLSVLNLMIQEDKMDSLWQDSLNLSQRYPGLADTINFYGPNCGELYIAMDTSSSGVGGFRIESYDSLGNSCGDTLSGSAYCVFGINIKSGPGYGAMDTSTWSSIAYFDTTGIVSQYFPNTDPLLSQWDHLVSAWLDDGSSITVHFGQDFCYGAQTSCDTIHTIYPCNFNLGQTVNPYIYNLRGKYRAFKNYTYLTPRTPGNLSTAANLRKDGYFLNFAGNFWTIPLAGSAGLWLKDAAVAGQDKWKWASEITNYSPHGTEIENMDALGNYSTALYGYKHTLPIAVSKNARYRQIAYDGFEDYYSNYFSTSCEKYYFRFNNFTHQLSTSEAHTGLRSMEVPSGDSVFVDKQMANYYGRRTTDAAPYLLQNEDLLGFFSPEIVGSNQTYLVSFWVKKSGFNPLIKSYTGIQPLIALNGTPYVLLTEYGPIIEGWQQIRAQFTILANSTGTIRFGVRNTTGDLYYLDDFRVHPFSATMQSFVYHPGNFRYMAQLDENNYATFYEYDEEGNLIRIKKETIRGVMTIQENRQKSFRYDLTNP